MDVIIVHVWGVLGRDEDGVHALRDHGTPVVFVLNRDLGLAVWPQPRAGPIFPGLQTMAGWMLMMAGAAQAASDALGA